MDVEERSIVGLVQRERHVIRWGHVSRLLVMMIGDVVMETIVPMTFVLTQEPNLRLV